MDDDPNIGRAVESGLERVGEFLPQLIGAILILVLGYFISKILAGIVQGVLNRLKFDDALASTAGGSVISRLMESPARFVGKVVFWLVFFGFITFAVAALDLPVLNNILESVYSYIPNVIAAVVIFLVASTISAGAAGFAHRVLGGTATAKLVSAVVPVVTMSLAMFMILNQLNIAKDIVNILFTAIVGAFALGLALAFGLGGRDVASQLLSQAYESAQSNAAAAKADVKQAGRAAKDKADRLK